MKICIKCSENKELQNFGRDKYKKDGLSAYCKSCISIRNAKKRIENSEYLSNYFKNYREKNRLILRESSKLTYLRDKERRLRQGRESYNRNKDKIAKKRKLKRSIIGYRELENIRIREWAKKNPEKYRASVRKWQIANRIKINAHAKVHRAVKNGILIRSTSCQNCKINCKTEGHHENYSKPLDVVWLCRKCHAKIIEKVKV